MAGVVVYGSAAALPGRAKAALAAAGVSDLFLSAEWFELLFQCCLTPEWQPAIYVVGDGDCIVVMAKGAAPARFRPRLLRSATNFYTMTYRPIFAPGADAAPALADFARALATGPQDVIEFRNIAVEDHAAAELTGVLRQAGFFVEAHPQFENWYEPTAGMSGQAYFQARPSRLRNTVERRARKAAREHALRMAIHQTPAEVAAALADWQRIYSASWKEPEQYPSFIPRFLMLCAEQRRLRLGILYIDEVPASAQIWLVVNRKATIYKLAYDEKYEALSVGSILTRRMFEHALDEDQVAEVDYGSGAEPYKKDWMSRCRNTVTLTAYNRRTAHGLLGAARSAAAGALKQWRGTRVPAAPAAPAAGSET